jgi:hypothetical protein
VNRNDNPVLYPGMGHCNRIYAWWAEGAMVHRARQGFRFTIGWYICGIRP